MRRVSFNVGCVTAITATGLQLDAPLLGGAPANGARVQKVMAFVDREGASFFQEWSALFALDETSGGQVYFYYPRLQAASPAEETTTALASGVNSTLLHAEFAALASTDANDGENVVCYRSYVPAPDNTGVLIGEIDQRWLRNCIRAVTSGSTSVSASRSSSRSHFNDTLRLASDSLCSGARVRNKGSVCSAKLRPRTEMWARCRLRFSSGKPADMPRSMSR